MTKKRKIIIFSSIVAFFLLIFMILRFSPYPQLEALKNQPYSTRIYDKNGEIIQILALEDGLRREWKPLQEIPKEVQKAFIAEEDKRFYFHNGVDVFSIFGAFFQNFSSKKIVRGASTISMQLAKIIEAKNPQAQKNPQPSQENQQPQQVQQASAQSPNSKNPSTKSTQNRFLTKVKDATNALRLEARLSKKQILELYLNNVPFGLNTEGVTSAARSFFSAELNQLTENQIKCLAVVPRRPAFYNPLLNPEMCAERAGVPVENPKPYIYPFYAPHFVENLKKNYEKLPPEIHTSLDLDLQNYAENILRTAMVNARDARIANSALLLIDNSTGQVLSWIGNSDWFDQENHGQIDGVKAKNQPGSSMKPFLYAMALEMKDDAGQPLYSPATILSDIPLEFGDENTYIPSNFNNRYNGPVRFRIALASSLNIPAVELLNKIGVENYLQKLYKLGFESLRQGGKEADLGLALGAGEVSLEELVYAFSVFVRDGKDFNDNQIYEKDAARLICSILSDSSARALGFGYSQTFQTDYPSIFKTGTANQYQNIVALGATKNYTIGVWMGNFEGQTVVGKTGSSLPAYVAKQVLDLLEKNKNPQNLQFPEPENWKKAKICSLSGMKAGKNCPATVMEYLFAGDDDNAENKEICTWHREKNDKTDGKNAIVEVVYPPEFQSWALLYDLDLNLNYNSSPLTINSPKNGSVFYYSLENTAAQAIKVDVTGGISDFLEVFYDEKPFLTVERPFSFFLPVEKGRHKITVICESESQSLEFTVY